LKKVNPGLFREEQLQVMATSRRGKSTVVQAFPEEDLVSWQQKLRNASREGNYLGGCWHSRSSSISVFPVGGARDTAPMHHFRSRQYVIHLRTTTSLLKNGKNSTLQQLYGDCDHIYS